MAASAAADAASGSSKGASEVRSDIVVCDNGTGYLKAGFGGQNLPEFSYPSMLGRPMLRAEEDVLDGIQLKVRCILLSSLCLVPRFAFHAATMKLLVMACHGQSRTGLVPHERRM